MHPPVMPKPVKNLPAVHMEQLAAPETFEWIPNPHKLQALAPESLENRPYEQGRQKLES